MRSTEFTYPAETLELMRAQFEIVESFLSRSRPHKEHDKRHPGRIQKLMAESDKFLQQAHWILGAIPEGQKIFSDKVYYIAFQDSLRLAHVHMVQATMDPRTILGEEVAKDRAKGQKASRETLSPEVQGIIDRLAKLALMPKGLWQEFETALDNLSMHPYADGNCIKFEDEVGDIREIQFENFKKKIYAARKKNRESA
jgi:hypothetical protein